MRCQRHERGSSEEVCQGCQLQSQTHSQRRQEHRKIMLTATITSEFSLQPTGFRPHLVFDSCQMSGFAAAVAVLTHILPVTNSYVTVLLFILVTCQFLLRSIRLTDCQ